jgi:hypothetical protein
VTGLHLDEPRLCALLDRVAQRTLRFDMTEGSALRILSAVRLSWAQGGRSAQEAVG